MATWEDTSAAHASAPVAQLGAPVCDVFDALLTRLNAAAVGHEQVRATLAAVREATGAELAYCFTGPAGTKVTGAGASAADVKACAAFARKLLAKVPADGGPLLWARRPGPG